MAECLSAALVAESVAIDSHQQPGEGFDDRLTERMLEVLRRDPHLHLPVGTVVLKHVRPPAKSLLLSGEATLESGEAPVALIFGPGNGAISERVGLRGSESRRTPGTTLSFSCSDSLLSQAGATSSRGVTTSSASRPHTSKRRRIW